MAKPLTDNKTDTAAPDLSAASSEPDNSPDIHRHRIAEQIRATAGPLEDQTDGAERRAHRLREIGALTAWAGISKDGDAVEQMLAAQLVATHDLTMITLNRAINRGHTGGYFGPMILDASRAMTANLRQIETLARYRTWKRLAEREAAIMLDGSNPP